MTDAAILVDNVVKRYERHVAVRDLSLRIPRGAVYGLLGPNGAGKTTTIRMLLNIIAPDEGTIRIFGERSDARDIGNRIGYLPEERGLYKKMRVRDVLRFLAELKGVPGREAERRIGVWLERLGLVEAGRDLARAKVDELSRGMQQKVQFIGALLHEPELLILDEPFSGLDPINAQALKDTVVELKRQGRTIIFSTHLMDNAERLCDAVCIIANGAKVLDGAVSEVKQRHGPRRVALAVGGSGNGAGDGGGGAAALAGVLSDRGLVSQVDDQNRFFEVQLAPQASPQALLRRLVEVGVEVARFELVQPSLHQIFLERVGATGVEPGMSGHG